MTALKGFLPGFYDLWIATRSQAGYPMGQQADPENVSNGTATHAYRVNHPISAAALAPTYEEATARAGMKVKGKRPLGISDYGNINITLSHEDEMFNQLIGKSALDEATVSGWNLTSSNIHLVDPPDLVVGLVKGFTTDDNEQFYQTLIYHNAQIRGGHAGANQSGGENPNPLEYNILLNTSPRTALGYLFSATGLNVVDDSDIDLKIVAQNPVTLTTYVDDGIATSFAVGYRPVSSAVDGSRNSFTQNGADSSGDVSAFSTTTGATTHTAGTAADIWVAAYETQWVAI
jgi:hypothetical protein